MRKLLEMRPRRHVAGCGLAALCVAAVGQCGAVQPTLAPPIVAPVPADTSPRAAPLPDLRLARELQRLRASAAGLGHPRTPAAEADANWLLGLLALHGIAMPMDAGHAQSRFERARQLGQRMAPAGLAWCAIDGCGGVPEPAAARHWVAVLRPYSPARAMYLDWLIDQKLAGLPVPEPTAAAAAAPSKERDKLLQAANAGDAQAQVETGIASAGSGRYDEALAWFRAAAGASPAAAANAQLLTQRERAASQAKAEPTAAQVYAQARRYHRGEGIPADYTEAIRLYRRAAQMGSDAAQRMLALIMSGRTATGEISVAWMAQLARVDAYEPVGVTVSPEVGAPSLARDPTPLYDLLPVRWRQPGHPAQ